MWAGGPVIALDSHTVSLSAVVDLIRTGAGRTRPELEHLTGLGRKLVAQRVAELIDAGLVAEDSLGPSTGGRAPRRLCFLAQVGLVLTSNFGASGMSAGITDLNGRVIARSYRSHQISDGPQSAIALALELWDEILDDPASELPTDAAERVWGVGVSVPGPVEFCTGRPVSPPIMPGWNDFPVREVIQQRWQVPVWVDNDVNVMALGEFRAGVAQDAADMVFVKIGTGIGAGIISQGALLRGAQGVAGDVGHIPVREHLGIACRCGRTDCLEAVCGGRALVAHATMAANTGASQILQTLLERDGALTIRHVSEASNRGDHVSSELLRTCGQRVGEMLSSLINTLNPAQVVLGGHVAESGDLILAAVRQAVYERSLPLATRDLLITPSADSDTISITGTAFTVIDQLFAPSALGRWIPTGRPSVDLNSCPSSEV